MNNSYDFVIVGNNIGALVCADSLASRFNVALVNPTPVWGGHFGGAVFNGDRYDLGMNYIEFTSFNEKSDDLLTYDPSRRNDCGRFTHFVEQYVSRLVDVREISTPQLRWGDQVLRDPLIANQFEDLGQLPKSLREKMAVELREAVAQKSSLHASRKKLTPELFLENSLETVSISNHGATLHNFLVEPFCRKVLNIGSAEIPALFHRIAWIPLIYPETLLNYLIGNGGTLPNTRFYYPVAGHFGILADRLAKRVAEKENVTILSEGLTSIRKPIDFLLQLKNGNSLKAPRLIWSMDLAQYLKLSEDNEPEPWAKTSIALAFLKIPTEKLLTKLSTLNVAGEKNSVYRVTDQTHNSGHDDTHSRLVAEINYDYHVGRNQDGTESGLADYVKAELKELGFVEDAGSIESISIKILRNALSLPTLGNLGKFNAAFSHIARNNDDHLILLSQASGFASTSLNDQIVQGLKMGKLFN